MRAGKHGKPDISLSDISYYDTWKTVAAIRDRGIEGARSKKKKGGQGQRGLGPRLQWDAAFYFLKSSECDPVRSKITASFSTL